MYNGPKQNNPPSFTAYGLLAKCLFCSCIFLAVAQTQIHALSKQVSFRQTVLNQPETTRQSTIEPNQLLVGVEMGALETMIQEQLADHGLTLVSYWSDIGVALVELEPYDNYHQRTEHKQINLSALTVDETSAQLETKRASLIESADFRYVTYNRRVWAANRSKKSSFPPLAISPVNVGTIPNDPEFPNQWPAFVLNVVKSWEITQGDPTVIIAVIDSGFDDQHPDLALSARWINAAEATGTSGVDDDSNGYIDDIWGWDWVDNDNDLSNDVYGHGTHIGGVISAVTNNNLGISGLGQNVTLLPLRIFTDLGFGYTSDLIDSLFYAKNAGARIVNLSLVLEEDEPALADSIALLANDMMIIAATGNENTHVYWPAAYDGVIAVSATERHDLFSPFSNSGPEVDLAAPGVSILSTDNALGYGVESGTSLASAHVSVLAGLISSLRPDFSNDEILTTMQNSAVDVNRDEYPNKDELIGDGRIDFHQALLAASSGLQSQLLDDTNRNVFSQTPVEYQIAVHAPTSREGDPVPVQGAVVHYRVYPENALTEESAESALIDGRSVTDAAGTALISLTAPLNQGAYTLQTQVGKATANFPITVFVPPSATELSIDSPTLRAGDGVTTVTLKASNPSGELAVAPIPLQLTTDSGTFANGQTSINAFLNKGVYTTTFYAATESGISMISAYLLNEQFATAEIVVTPNTPKLLEISFDPATITPELSQTTITLTVATKDMYGNSLNSELLYNIYTSLDETLLTLAQPLGETSATIELSLSSDIPEKVITWVSLPEYGLFSQTSIDVTTDSPTGGTALLPDPDNIPAPDPDTSSPNTGSDSPPEPEESVPIIGDSMNSNTTLLPVIINP